MLTISFLQVQFLGFAGGIMMTNVTAFDVK